MISIGRGPFNCFFHPAVPDSSAFRTGAGVNFLHGSLSDSLLTEWNLLFENKITSFLMRLPLRRQCAKRVGSSVLSF